MKFSHPTLTPEGHSIPLVTSKSSLAHLFLSHPSCPTKAPGKLLHFIHLLCLKPGSFCCGNHVLIGSPPVQNHAHSFLSVKNTPLASSLPLESPGQGLRLVHLCHSVASSWALTLRSCHESALSFTHLACTSLSHCLTSLLTCGLVREGSYYTYILPSLTLHVLHLHSSYQLSLSILEYYLLFPLSKM